MKKTSNYQLNQWDAEDKVQRTDFNADNAKIDAAIRGVDKKADGLSTSKADKTALDALAQTVSGHTSTLAQKGNCQIVTGSYTGSGTCGSAKARTLTFPFQPKLVVVQNQAAAQMDVAKSSDMDRFMLILVRPLEMFYLYQSTIPVHISWGSKSVSWWSDHSDSAQLNSAVSQYTYVAIG